MPDEREALTPGLREFTQYQFKCPECPMHLLVKDHDLLQGLLDRYAPMGGVSLATIDAVQKSSRKTRRRRS
jgi:hypothetical protein